MLDNEIDRLDRAVKTFLNFTKPVELKSGGDGSAGPSRRESWMRRGPQLPRPARELQADLPAGLSARSGGPPAHPSGGAESAAERVRLHRPRRDELPSRFGAGGDYAVIEVADSGKGISPEDQKKIFQLFLHDAAGRHGNRVGEYVSICAVAQWPDRI